MPDRPTILIVDDEPSITDLYALRLEDEYEVRTAYSGEEALEKIDDAVDIVLLDRRMPDLSGDDVLSKIRDEGIDCRVAMVTAVDPDFDILDLGFDAYVVKPVSEQDLKTTVQTLLRRASYDEQLREMTALMSKKAALESEKSEEELESNDEYVKLDDRLEHLHEQLDETVEELDEEDFSAAFHSLSRRRSRRKTE
jgi:DNA-binding response OmpR family regulator